MTGVVTATRMISPRARRVRLVLALGLVSAACVEVAGCGGGGGSSSMPDGGSSGTVRDASGDVTSAEASTATDGAQDTGASQGAPVSCAQLTVPLATGQAGSHFIIILPAGVDFSNATVSALVYAPEATAGVIQAYVQEGAANSYTQTFLGWKNLTSALGWTTFSWAVTGANATATERIGLSIETGLSGDASATFEEPDTIVYVASVTVTGTTTSVGPFVFDMSSTVGPPTPKYPSEELWLNVDDSYVPGSSVVWDSTCGTPVSNDSGSAFGVDSGDAMTGAESDGGDASAVAESDAGDASTSNGSDGGDEGDSASDASISMSADGGGSDAAGDASDQ